MRYDLPLFPLNLVLFPGTPVHLHIFEERYKQMVAYCQETGSPFGVVLIHSGLEALGPPAEPAEVGCSAQIAHVEALEQGRMNLVVLGQERFRIVALKHDRPYLMGEVEALPMPLDDPPGLTQAQQRLSPWLERYVRQLSRGGPDVDFQRIAAEPLIYLNMAAMLLQIPLEQKQELLEVGDALRFADELRVIYRREVALLGSLMREADDQVAFSRN